MIFVNKTYVTIVKLSSLLLILAFAYPAQASTTDDPLKNSRKLIKKGHVSLYKNGAFPVPMTRLKIIPAGPSPYQLAKELMGIRARQSFLLSLENAADSIYIIPQGTKFSLDISSSIKDTTDNIGSTINDSGTRGGLKVIDKSIAIGKKSVFGAWRFNKTLTSEMRLYSIGIENSLTDTGNTIQNSSKLIADGISDDSNVAAKNINKSSSRAAKRDLLFAGNYFIKGYTALPGRLSGKVDNISNSISKNNFTKSFNSSNQVRKKFSRVFTNLFNSVTEETKDNIQRSFSNAGNSFDNVESTGFALAALKSARWVLQGVLWDSLIEPMAKVGTASAGYIAVNAALFPSLVVINEGIAITNIAAEVVWNSATASYDIVAPTAISAIAASYGLLEYGGGKALAASTFAGGKLLSASTHVGGNIIGTSVKGVAYIGGKSSSYVGIPIAAAGITLSRGAVGVVAGGAGVAVGSGIIIGSKSVAVGTRAFGNIIAGTTLVTGTTAAVATSAAVASYEISKAIVVPAGYQLGGGIVLSYGSMSHLAAHSILAVSDAAYLVLSLEGPRWVVYAVSGKLGNGEALPTGAILDLKQMQNNGEEIQYLPISDTEMTNLVGSVYENLPNYRTDLDNSPEIEKDMDDELFDENGEWNF